MPQWSDFFQGLDGMGMLSVLLSAAAALFCITLHECAHGLVAYRLGDPTAKRAGRLSLAPWKHIDPVGLLLMVTAHVGWAKAVPVDPRYFRDPKRGMALTALAGPVSNVLLTAAALALEGILLRHAPLTLPVLVLLSLLSNVAVLSLGLGIFNLIPISPLDGSKVLFALLPDRAYEKLLRYERYGIFLVLLLTLAGVLDGPLSTLIGAALEGLCALTGCPVTAVYGVMDLAALLG